MKAVIGLVLAFLLVVGELTLAKHARAGSTIDDVAIELMCQCGCRLVLPACNMPECKIQKSMIEQIKYQMDKGLSKEEVIKSFVDNYGEAVLAAPTKKGFNLAAWLIPFAAITGGLGFVYLVVDQWVLRRGRRQTDDEEAVEDEVSSAELPLYEKWLRKELDDREGGA
ncbi:MAG: cytochrome c-type biogenesis protein CcmH [Chloroflexi bacterium]|nr:cytochrome c-type biogenesis protein CcmH [Chloroflexota bacterium]